MCRELLSLFSTSGSLFSGTIIIIFPCNTLILPEFVNYFYLDPRLRGDDGWGEKFPWIIRYTHPAGCSEGCSMHYALLSILWCLLGPSLRWDDVIRKLRGHNR